MSAPNIPGYSVVEKIREGATATSWKAIQNSLKRPVVLKILNTEGTPDDKEKIESILTQMRKVSSLKHSAFFELIDMGELDGMHYVVMGGSDGQALATLLEEHNPLPEKDILCIATEIAEALDYAWNTKLLYHGNIKPDNIVIHSDGRVLIADMGMARVEVHFDPTTGQTHEMIVGTPNYMSPEQVQGRGSLDFRTDIYSLGATLYHLATGVVPFSDSAGEETMQRHLVDCLPDPRDINPDISPALAGVITKMMIKNPERRYQSWSDVFSDLNRAATNRLQVPKIDEGSLSTVKMAATKATPQPAARSPRPVAVIRSAPSVSVQPSAQQQKQAPTKKSGVRSALRLTRWLLVLGVWIVLAYVLLKPPTSS